MKDTVGGRSHRPARTVWGEGASEKYRMRLKASTPTAPASDSGSGPTAAAATDNTAAEARAAGRKEARRGAPPAGRRARHRAGRGRAASTHKGSSKTSAG